jgi:hypothetical protein
MQRNERAGYAGSLAAANPGLSGRFHFWLGGSGRRYATTRYAPGAVPPYDLAVALFLKREAEGLRVLEIAANLTGSVAPEGTDEIHVHVVERVEALAFAHRDLRALVDGSLRPKPVSTGDKIIRFYPRHAA